MWSDPSLLVAADEPEPGPARAKPAEAAERRAAQRSAHLTSLHRPSPFHPFNHPALPSPRDTPPNSTSFRVTRLDFRLMYFTTWLVQHAAEMCIRLESILIRT